MLCIMKTWMTHTEEVIQTHNIVNKIVTLNSQTNLLNNETLTQIGQEVFIMADGGADHMAGSYDLSAVK